ncbi:MAG: transporter substrate-binding domain-containing protein [Marinobacter sp.]|nr:transporter substrate-binding domain-containing protein [Marinobacter sp.]
MISRQNMLSMPRQVGFLLLFLMSTLTLAESLPCRVVVGPTSDPELTDANLEWTEHIVEYLSTRGTRCKVIFVNAWARANLMFSDQRIDVLFPEIVGDPTQPGTTGRPVALTYGFVVFSRLNNGPFDSPSELRGLRVGTIRGRFYPASLVDDPRIRVEPANSLEQNLNKLMHGRIDATVEYLADGLRQLEAMNLLNRVHYGEEFAIEELAYRFHSTPEGEQLKALFDQAIQALIEDGTYSATFGGTTQRLIH